MVLRPTAKGRGCVKLQEIRQSSRKARQCSDSDFGTPAVLRSVAPARTLVPPRFPRAPKDFHATPSIYTGLVTRCPSNVDTSFFGATIGTFPSQERGAAGRLGLGLWYPLPYRTYGTPLASAGRKIPNRTLVPSRS